jgi:hypothetical protein
VSIVEVLDRCYERHGTEPTIKEIELFARANGIPFPRRERGRPWSSYVTEWKEGRRARGLPVPSGPPPTSQRPDYSEDVGAALPEERRMRRRWDDRDELVEWAARYLSQLKLRERPSQRGYDAWAANNPGAPRASAFQRQHDGWEAVRDAARERTRPHKTRPGRASRRTVQK